MLRDRNNLSNVTLREFERNLNLIYPSLSGVESFLLPPDEAILLRAQSLLRKDRKSLRHYQRLYQMPVRRLNAIAEIN